MVSRRHFIISTAAAAAKGRVVINAHGVGIVPIAGDCSTGTAVTTISWCHHRGHSKAGLLSSEVRKVAIMSC